MKLIALAASALAMLGTVAHAQEWREVERTPTSLTALDFSRITGPAVERQFWTVRSRRVAESDGTAYTVTNWKIDCRMRVLTHVSLQEFATSGRVTFDGYTEEVVNVIQPGTTGDTFRRAACDGWKPQAVAHDGARGFHLWAQGYFSRQ